MYVHEVVSTNRSLLVPLPATVDKGRKLVCMRAEEEKEEDSICAVLPYHEEALEVRFALGFYSRLMNVYRIRRDTYE